MHELDLASVSPELRTVLVIGQEGSGKTHFIGTCPKPVYLFSFDDGYRTLAGIEGIKVVVFEDVRRRPKMYSEFGVQFDKVLAGEKYTWPDGRVEEYATIALDGLTFLSESVLDYFQYVNSNIDKPPGFAGYGYVKNHSRDFLNKIRQARQTVVATGLVDVSRDETTGEIFYVPAMQGSIKDEIGAYFDAVFYLKVDKKTDGRVVRSLLTVGSRREKAKVRIPSSITQALDAAVEPNYEQLQKCILNAWDKVRKGREEKSKVETKMEVRQ